MNLHIMQNISNVCSVDVFAEILKRLCVQRGNTSNDQEDTRKRTANPLFTDVFRGVFPAKPVSNCREQTSPSSSCPAGNTFWF